MDEVITLAVAVLSGALLVLALIGIIRLTAIQLALYGTPVFLLSIHAVDNKWDTSFRIAVLTTALISGYFLARALTPPPRTHSTMQRALSKPRPLLRPRTYAGPVVTFTSLFCVYHFSVVGLPILSSNVELQRLDVGSSGLLGIPSRMYLYGVVFALAVAIAEARSRSIPISRSTWVRVAYATLVITRLVSGFKSGVVEVMIDTILLAVLSVGGVRVTRYFGRFVLGGVVAVAFVFLVGATYQSYAASQNSLLVSLENRLTAVSATPVWIVMNSTPSSVGEPRRPVELDLDYFRYRYLGIRPIEQYGFTRLVSAVSVGDSPYIAGTLAPVALSAYAVLYYQFGWLGVLACLGLGAVIRISEVRAYQSTSSPIAFGVWACVAVAALEFVSRGEIVYALINWTVTCLVLVGLALAWNVLRKNSGSPRAGAADNAAPSVGVGSKVLNVRA